MAPQRWSWLSPRHDFLTKKGLHSGPRRRSAPHVRADRAGRHSPAKAGPVLCECMAALEDDPLPWQPLGIDDYELQPLDEEWMLVSGKGVAKQGEKTRSVTEVEVEGVCTVMRYADRLKE